jgi:hypothetical protein
MNISVEHINQTGTVSNKTFRLTRLAFAKHLAIAGQGYAPRPQWLLRTIGMLFHYGFYIQRQAFYSDRFSEPPTPLSDPTEKAQFSNLAGKAIADFLSKKIDNSLYTVNYEAVMRLQGQKLKGQRPDLVAYSPTSMFAIEAKGRHQGNSGDMVKHKTQAQSGTVGVNFSVACVSYNLFNQVRCNYHDPYNDNIPYDNETLRLLTKNYYQGLSEFLNEKIFEYREFQMQGETFYEIELFYRRFDTLLPDEFPFRPFRYFEIFEFYRPRLILPKDIFEYAKNGITNDIKPFSFDAKEDDSLYIDNDRIGLRIRS